MKKVKEDRKERKRGRRERGRTRNQSWGENQRKGGRKVNSVKSPNGNGIHSTTWNGLL